MELIDGMIADDGMVFGPTIEVLSPDMMIEFNAQSDWSNTFIFTLDSYFTIVNVAVDWGDGYIENFNSNSSEYASHIYSNSGTKMVKIYGTNVDYISFDHFGKLGLIGILSWGNFQFGDFTSSFYGCANLIYLPNNLPSTVMYCDSMLNLCETFNDSNVITWDTSNVASMSSMFSTATAFNQNIGGWNTSNVTSMSGMFGGAIAFDANISSWDTSNVGSMSSMFNNATNFNQDIGNWNVGSVADMNFMFNNATNFNQDLTNWCVVNIPSEPANFATSSILDANNYPNWGTCNSSPTPSSLPILMTYDSSLGNNVQFDIWGNVNITIDWGDGNIKQYIGSDVIKSHTYATSNIFTMSIYGSANNISTNGNANGITSVIDWGGVNGLYGISLINSAVTNVPPSIPSTFTWLIGTFAGCTNFNDSNVTLWDTSNINNMFQTFQGASAFNQDISSWNTSNVTSFGSMFSFANSFNQNINSWDTSNAVDTSFMFSYANSYNQPMNSWDTSKVITMNQMFQHATSFNGNITTWDVSNVANMTNMFREADVFNQNIGSWNTGNVSDMSLMFYSAYNFNQNIGSWNTSNVSNMRGMFYDVTSFNQDIGSWNTSNVTDMYLMFYNASSFNQDLHFWDTRNVTDMSWMFTNATAFNGNISTWNTSNVTNMALMFAGPFLGTTLFNGNIGSWNTGNVSNMYGMFNSATSFNQDLSHWCVTNIVSEPVAFSVGSALTTGNKPVWGTCPP